MNEGTLFLHARGERRLAGELLRTRSCPVRFGSCLRVESLCSVSASFPLLDLASPTDTSTRYTGVPARSWPSSKLDSKPFSAVPRRAPQPRPTHQRPPALARAVANRHLRLVPFLSRSLAFSELFADPHRRTTAPPPQPNRPSSNAGFRAPQRHPCRQRHVRRRVQSSGPGAARQAREGPEPAYLLVGLLGQQGQRRAVSFPELIQPTAGGGPRSRQLTR